MIEGHKDKQEEEIKVFIDFNNEPDCLVNTLLIDIILRLGTIQLGS